MTDNRNVFTQFGSGVNKRACSTCEIFAVLQRLLFISLAILHSKNRLVNVFVVT